MEPTKHSPSGFRLYGCSRVQAVRDG